MINVMSHSLSLSLRSWHVTSCHDGVKQSWLQRQLCLKVLDRSQRLSLDVVRFLRSASCRRLSSIKTTYTDHLRVDNYI